MSKKGTKITTIIFLMIIFLFGATTFWNSKHDIKTIFKEAKITVISDEIEAALADNFACRNNWINVNGLFQKSIGVTIIRDPADIDVYKMNNGQLTYEYPDCDMREAAVNIDSLNKYAQSIGTDLVYVQLPCKANSDELMPIGTHTYGDADSDDLLAALESAGVNTLDIRDEIARSNMDYSSLFFNTDHHWKPTTAMWAAGRISNWLNNNVSAYDYDSSIYELDNYNIKTYENIFLGSLGRRTGKYFGGVEDFDIVTPKFDTCLSFDTVSQSGKKKGHREGDFTDALLKLEYLEDDDLFNGMTYFTYLGNEYRLARVQNQMAQNNKKVLLIRDSFSCAMLPFLSLSSADITAVDLRYYTDVDIRQLMKEENYDAVIIAYNPSMFREDGAFDF